MTDPREPEEPEPADRETRRLTEAERRRRRARVFGEVLPEQTRDDRPTGTPSDRDPADRDDEWLRGEVPPHHG